VSSHAGAWNGFAKLLALAPGAMHSRCGADGPPEGTCGGAAGVSISQAHEVSGIGQCCALARLNDPLTDRSILLEQGPAVSVLLEPGGVACRPYWAPPGLMGTASLR